MSAILKFDFQKKENNYVFLKKLSKLLNTQFCMWQLHFP